MDVYAFGILLWTTMWTIFDQWISQTLIAKKNNTLPNADLLKKKFKAFEAPLLTVVLQCKDNCCEPVVLILQFHVYLRGNKVGTGFFRGIL